MSDSNDLLPEPPPVLDRLRLRRDLARLLGRIDRPALAAVRRRCRDTSPSAYASKYWRLRDQLAKNLRRAYRLALHRPPRDLAVLDLGTGFGYFPCVCRFYGHRAVGLDLEDGPDSVYRAVTGLLGVERLGGTIRPREPLPVSGHRFDLVTGFAVLFNQNDGRSWSAEDWRFFLADLTDRLLTSRGRLFLSLNRDRTGRYLDPESEALFRAAGATIAGHDVYFPKLDPAAAPTEGNGAAIAAAAEA